MATARLIKREFVKWLRAQDPKARPAVCGDSKRCILAQFIVDTVPDAGIVLVDGERYITNVKPSEVARLQSTGLGHDDVGRELPAWAEKVASDFDNLELGSGYPYGIKKSKPTVARIREALSI